MANILGLRDTSTFSANRFENWRRLILYLFPNGMAPLTALLSLTEPEETNDPHFNWYEKVLPDFRSSLTAAFGAGDVLIKVASNQFAVSDMILDTLTNEQMEVTGVDPTGLQLTVLRGKWGAAVASSGASDPIKVIGNVNAEGGFIPQALSIDPNPIANKTQIFRNSLALAGTAMNTAVKWDRTGPYREMLRETLSYHSVDMEWAFILGQQAEYNDPTTGKLKRTTGGVVSFLPGAYQVAPANAGGAITSVEWGQMLEFVFRAVSNQANEKIALCGSGALNALNQVALTIGKMETVAGDESFGMALTRWYTPFGTLYLRTHPLFTQDPTWRYNILILDVHNLVYRHMIGRDTQRLTNRQSNDQDARMDEFLTEAGLEVHHFGVGSGVAGSNITLNAQAGENGTHLLVTNVVSAGTT